MFFFAVDIACVNGFILGQLKLGKTVMRDQLAFRCALVDSLLLAGASASRNPAGYPAGPKRQRRNRPLPEFRLEHASHLPVVVETPGRCAYCTYVGRTEGHRSKFQCANCFKFLCLNNRRNCFVDWHSLEDPSP